MTRHTQRALVELLLRSRGAAGVSARELIYEHGITRAASIVHRLRSDGWHITTSERPGETAVYSLCATGYTGATTARSVPPPPAPEPLGAGEQVSWQQLRDQLRR